MSHEQTETQKDGVGVPPLNPICVHPRSSAVAPFGGPYLSIVATARNDNHGGDLLRRMQLFIDGLADQAERHALPSELVLVEWNPPHDAPPLAEVLRWPAGAMLSCRIVQVPAHVHRRFRYSDRLPLFQMIAKNVGIRRSRGRFVLATNVDILLSEALFARLAQRDLREDAFYRCDRHDAESDVPADASPRERLDWCAAHVIRRNEYDGIRDERTGEFHRIHWERKWRVRLLEFLQDRRLVPIVTRPRVHVNACGDFTLMSRTAWDRLRGYPEPQMFSMHLDSLLLYQARAAGLREVVLPGCAYHIEHSVGSGWSVEGEAKLNERLAERGIEQLPVERLNAWAVRMRRDRRAMEFNEDSWGLAEEALPEVHVDPAASPISRAKPQAA